MECSAPQPYAQASAPHASSGGAAPASAAPASAGTAAEPAPLKGDSLVNLKDGTFASVESMIGVAHNAKAGARLSYSNHAKLYEKFGCGSAKPECGARSVTVTEPAIGGAPPQPTTDWSRHYTTECVQCAGKQ